MGHGYQPHRLCQHNIHHRTTTTTTTTTATATFLPTLCRVSINDVKLTQHKTSCAAAAASFSDEPSSPRVSCIGQVKRNNKVLGFPTPHHNFVPASAARGGGVNNITHSYSFKNPNLKRLFAGKSLTPTTVTAAGCRRVSRNCTRRSRKVTNNKDNQDENCGGGVDISEMDPPLPVVKKVQPPAAGGEASLWKRRSGGAGLKTLQIQLDKNNQLIPPSTV